jgi:small subunit ribosomal protein S14
MLYLTQTNEKDVKFIKAKQLRNLHFNKIMQSRKKQRKHFETFELKSKVLSSLSKNRALKSSIRWYLNVVNSQKLKKSSKVRFKNRCVLSNRSRSLYRFARLSRLFLRDPLYVGTLPGLRKSYW